MQYKFEKWDYSECPERMEAMFDWVRKTLAIHVVIAENESCIVVFGNTDNPHTESELRAFAEFLNKPIHPQERSPEAQELLDEAIGTAEYLENKKLRYSGDVVRRLHAKIIELTTNKENV